MRLYCGHSQKLQYIIPNAQIIVNRNLMLFGLFRFMKYFMDTKMCRGPCGQNKNITEYFLSKQNKDGLHSYCKECSRLKSKEWSIRKNKEWGININKNKHKKQTQAEIREKQRKRKNHRIIKDPNFRLISNLRSRTCKLLKNTKSKKTEELLGCSIENFWIHLEKQFTEGMTRENHGKFGWHIDHIIPLSSAKTQQEIEKLFHYTNCQPMWAKDNHKKGNRY